MAKFTSLTERMRRFLSVEDGQRLRPIIYRWPLRFLISCTLKEKADA